MHDSICCATAALLQLLNQENQEESDSGSSSGVFVHVKVALRADLKMAAICR